MTHPPTTEVRPCWTTNVFSPLLLALLSTGLASVKPMHIDETAYYYYAAHIADHPLDPYGFEVFWYQHPQPANGVLAPPVLLYWWALGMRLLRPLGEQPLLWKLWLLPFVLLFVFSLLALLRRFARGLETPLLWMTVLSPAILPGLNLMPDIPALSLGLCAIVVFLHAMDTSGGASCGWAVLAGLLAGLAMQTKYTGFLAPMVLLAAAVVFRRWWLWPFAAVPAATVFVAWEAATAHLYGDSHFLLQLRGSSQSVADKATLFLPLLSLLGGTAAAVGLLGLTALGARRSVVSAAGVIIVAGYATVACVGVTFGWDGPAEAAPVRFTLSDLIYAIWGVALAGILAALIGRWPKRRVEWFLILWLGLELAGYFFLTPFPAVRRVLGLYIVTMLFVGHVASQSCLSPERRRLVGAVAAFSSLLGVGFLGLDVCDALAQQRAAETAALRVREQDAPGRVWYVGHWGFQFYAERAGMRPVIPDVTPLRAGDWLILPDDRLEQQWLVGTDEATRPAFTIAVGDPVPLRTVRGYYGGWTPLEHQSGSRLNVEVRRVVRDFKPLSGKSRLR